MLGPRWPPGHEPHPCGSTGAADRACWGSPWPACRLRKGAEPQEPLLCSRQEETPPHEPHASRPRGRRVTGATPVPLASRATCHSCWGATLAAPAGGGRALGRATRGLGAPSKPKHQAPMATPPYLSFVRKKIRRREKREIKG
jgi:hypothetical protein